jgi:DNA ligase D-like protein (predicted 3'-phosphoesterase)
MDKDVFSLPEGSFVLCKALAIPGHSDHSAIQVVRNVRNNKDYQDLFVKLGEEQMGEGEKNSKFWASFKKKLMGIKAKSKGVDVSIEEIKMAIDESEEEANIEKNAGLTVMSARDPLSKYKSKRDFDETKEPEGKVEMKNKHRFVIQSHKATNWHFDLRLENDNGVLQSWTIPKHKIPRASEKLLAIETEPHPVSYIKFQGEIDEGYGKGTVEIFASGTYVPIEITKDKKIFEIKTGKAKGTYVLVKTGGKRWMFLRAREEVKK